MKKKKVKEIGITALYERLSRDDDGDGDSNSIVHQKQMLETYAKEHGFINLHHYTDDGWSGASFDRPAWNELVSGVKDGKITTVIVKDLSRVGRDHLQVGFFTDILFREKEVRFIAVGNSIDSNDQQSNEFAPFLNIMNEWYAEFSALQSGSAELRTKLETLQPDISALKNIRKYIDMVLNKQQLSVPGGKTPEKESVLKKLEEAKATQTTKKTETKNHTQEL